MNNYRKALENLEKHPKKWEKALFHFIYSNRSTPFQTDLYYYPDTKEFWQFENPGGSSMIDDNHITVYYYSNEFGEEFEKGYIRETAYNYKTEIIPNILKHIAEELEQQAEQIEYDEEHAADYIF